MPGSDQTVAFWAAALGATATPKGMARAIVTPWQRSREALDGIARFAEDVLSSDAVRGHI